MPATTDPQALFQRDLAETYPVIARGEGIYLYDEEGRRYMDGIAGAGNVTLGHGRRRIAQAMAEQAEELAYCFSPNFTNRPALELAERVAQIAPGDLNHAYFVSGGSEAIETAIKIARQYHLQRGNASKQMVISRWRSYHGATLGALSLTGLPAMRAPFAPWLADFPHIAPCYPYRCTFAGCAGRCTLACADDLERTIRNVGPENVAAFVAEPVVLAGIAAGAPPPDYFPRIREICDRYDVLFIADEVITGFGRTAKYFAIEHWGVTPDLIAFAKGISGGYVPLGGVLMRSAVRDAFADAGSWFAHIFTYVNNPVAIRAGLEVLDIIEEENILQHVEEVSGYLQAQAETLLGHPTVGDLRSMGLILGLELVQDRERKTPFPQALGVQQRLRQILLDQGLSLYVTGGVANGVDGEDIRFYPPLIITRAQIDEAIGMLDAGLSELEAAL